jgi:hypothetical protein
VAFDSVVHYTTFDKALDHPTREKGGVLGRKGKRDQSGLHDTEESALWITDAFFCLPFLLTPTEKGLYGGPSFGGADATTIVSTPQGISKADKSIHEFQASNQASMLVIERARLWRVYNRTIVAMGWRVS